METVKIGVGITTRNRREVFYKAVSEWTKYLPAGARLVVVDDASEEPLWMADTVFEEQQGIAKAKNECIRLLNGCEHIFLVDDDVWPTTPDWHVPYIAAGVNHLCLSFEVNSKGQRLSNTVYETGSIPQKGLTLFNAPNGCMLYVRSEVIRKTGGMSPEFGVWGFEHVDWSERIHAAGLTEHPFMDVTGSLDLFHVSDYFGEVESSVPTQVRIDHAQVNKSKYEERKGKVIYERLYE